MEKNQQAKINAKCLASLRSVALDYSLWHTDFVELSKDKAEIATTNDYVVLLSFGKLVAWYRISSGTLVDVLRHRVGYNSTSAQHIAKFCDVMVQRYGRCEMMQYYPV